MAFEHYLNRVFIIIMVLSIKIKYVLSKVGYVLALIKYVTGYIEPWSRGNKIVIVSSLN